MLSSRSRRGIRLLDKQLAHVDHHRAKHPKRHGHGKRLQHRAHEIAGTNEHPFRCEIAQEEMVDRNQPRGDGNRLPVADQGQRGEADEEEHMGFHLPGMTLQHVNQHRRLEAGHDAQHCAGAIVIALAQCVVGGDDR